ncbi:profilin [Syncephalis fuscata]|nr:profilin [Syncephalis fuscata]
MSWNAYVDNLLATGKVNNAAIFGHNGQQWAASAGFTVSQDEINQIIAGFANPSGVQASGIRAVDTKYFALECNNASLYGKKGADGIACVKTNQTIVIGTYAAPTAPGEATVEIEKIGDYLRNSGYVSK